MNSWVHSTHGYHNAKVKSHHLNEHLYESSDNEKASFHLENMFSKVEDLTSLRLTTMKCLATKLRLGRFLASLLEMLLEVLAQTSYLEALKEGKEKHADPGVTK